MSAGQAPANFQAHEMGEFTDLNNPTPNIHALGMNRFLVGRNPHVGEHAQHDGLHAIDNSRFLDFPIQPADATGVHINNLGESQVTKRLSEPYHIQMSGSITDRQGSIDSPDPRRTSFNDVSTGSHANAGSTHGSDGATPESNRLGPPCGYTDEFGINNVGAADGSDLGAKAREEKNDATPAWTELKTKAGKERKRLPLACIACRRKKIRCSGEKPACKHCLRSRMPCIYKVTTRKAAPRTDYMVMLDKRLKRMEERIIKIVPKDELRDNVTRAQVKPSMPGTILAGTSTKRKRAVNEAFGSELESWSKSTTNVEVGVVSSLLVQEAEETRLLTEGADALPSQEIQEHLSEVYFDHLHGQAYHLLHKPSFMRKLRAGTLPPVLILAVCAVSARFSTHPKLNTNPAFLRGEEWASEARKIVLRRYEWPNITILTCLLLLGLHEFGTCYGGRSWAFGGMAIRMAYALQLHKDLPYDPCKKDPKNTLSFVDREIRRRTMWACFLMDRFNSSGTDRPMFVKEETLSLQLPIKDKYFQLEMEGPTENLRGNVPYPVPVGEGRLSNAKENMGIAAHVIRAIALWGKIIIYLFQGGRELDPYPPWRADSHFAKLQDQVDSFSGNLSDVLKYTRPNLETYETEGLANQFLFMHITVQGCVLMLNHTAARGYRGGQLPPSIPLEFIGRSTAKAYDAGTQISEILRDAEPHSLVAPFAGYCAFLSSIVQMPSAFSKNASIEMNGRKNLATNVRYMARMKKHWGAFHWTSENLKAQYKVCASAAQQAQDGKAPGDIPCSIYQYADWFDRYPYGVSQTDFEDPASDTNLETGDDAVLGQKSDYHTVEEFFNTLSSQQPETPETARGKRKSTKKASTVPPQQQQPGSSEPIVSNVPPAQEMQLPGHAIAPLTPNCHQMPQANNTGSFANPNFYGSEFNFPPPGQGIVPHLDRQLVFGAYAGMEPSNSGQPHSSAHEVENWDLGLENMGAYVAEPTSAWFMPFNMDLPDLSTDNDFASVGSAGVGYSMGVMPVNNQGDMNGMGDGTGGP